MQESVFVDMGNGSIFEGQRLIYDNYKELSGGIWYPFLFKLINYDMKDSGKAIPVMDLIVYETDLNIGIPDDYFDFSRRDVVEMGIDFLK